MGKCPNIVIEPIDLQESEKREWYKVKFKELIMNGYIPNMTGYMSACPMTYRLPETDEEKNYLEYMQKNWV